MMVESIVLIIFVLSLGGILLMIIRKIPVLNSLPQNGNTGIKEYKIFLSVENKIKNIYGFYEKQIFLHKFLSWVKVLTLKVETRVDALLHKIRRKAQEAEKKV